MIWFLVYGLSQIVGSIICIFGSRPFLKEGEDMMENDGTSVFFLVIERKGMMGCLMEEFQS